jgi:hypothetical protein
MENILFSAMPKPSQLAALQILQQAMNPGPSEKVGHENRTVKRSQNSVG